MKNTPASGVWHYALSEARRLHGGHSRHRVRRQQGKLLHTEIRRYQRGRVA